MKSRIVYLSAWLRLKWIYYLTCRRIKSDPDHWIQYFRESIDKMAIPQKKAIVENIQDEKVKGLIVKSSTSTIPGKAILYFHGGAYVFCSPKGYIDLCYNLSSATNMAVYCIDYRLAPEHPFPAALEDAINAYHYLLQQGYAPGNIYIGGDSAGGGLAVATLLSIRDSNDPAPAACFCISPFLDMAREPKSAFINQNKDYILPYPIEWFRTWKNMYLQNTDPANPLASPMRANLKGLPPLLLQAGGNELLLDDSCEFAAKAKEAGVDVTLEVWKGMSHDWHMLATFLPEGKAAIKRIGEFLKTK